MIQPCSMWIRDKLLWLALLTILCLKSYGQVDEQMLHLTLKECIDRAQEVSLQVESVRYNEELAIITARQAKHNRYPTLEATSNYGLNVGRRIDPVTNAFDNQQSTFQNYGLNLYAPIYQGGAIHNNIRQTELKGQSARFRVEQSEDNIALQVAQWYLNAMLAQEARTQAQIRYQETENQIERIDRLIQAGSLPPNDRLEYEAQLLRDAQEITLSENNESLALINLKNLLVLPANTDLQLQKIDIESISVDENRLAQSTEAIYQMALRTQPGIFADSLDLASVELDRSIAQAQLLPTLGLSAVLSTNYSSLSKRAISTNTIYTDIPVIINEMELNVGFPSTQVTLGSNPYFNQLNENIGYGIGLGLRIPIYNNLTARTSVERADVAIKQQKNQNDQNKQQLKNDIQNTMTQARAAYASWQAAQKSLVAQRASLRNIEARVEAGGSSHFELITAENNVRVAENALLQAQYDYIFSMKVLDYYMGIPIELN